MKVSIVRSVSCGCLLFSSLAISVVAQKLPAPAVSTYRPVSPVRSATPARPASTFGSNTGWGSVANPGTGHPPNTTTSGLVKNSFYSGVGTSSSIGKKSRAKGLYGGAYAYPLYVPNYYDSSNYVDPQESFAGSNAPDRPSVVIQNFYPSGNATQQQPDTESRLETYRAPSREPVMESPADTAVKQGNYYLIAYKDHHVYSALAYWIEGETFHYVTTENTHNQAALSAIDQEMTKRLNQDRNMTFSAGQ